MSNLASIDRVGSRVVWLMGARSDAFEFEIDDDRFSKYEIANAIVETESDIVQLLADTHHPRLDLLLRWYDVEHGEVVPKHLGKIEAVKTQSAGCGDEVMCEPATRTDVKLWRENYESIFDDTECETGSAGYYNLTNQVITFTGDTAEALMVVYDPVYPDQEAETYGTLQIDSVFEPMLVNGAITRLAKIGVPRDLVLHNANQYDTAKRMIAQGMMMKPEVDAEMRADNP